PNPRSWCAQRRIGDWMFALPDSSLRSYEMKLSFAMVRVESPFQIRECLMCQKSFLAGTSRHKSRAILAGLAQTSRQNSLAFMAGLAPTSRQNSLPQWPRRPSSCQAPLPPNYGKPLGGDPHYLTTPLLRTTLRKTFESPGK